MAIYHCSMKAISRGAGQSIVASAAYRHACKLTDLRSGLVHDYSRKRGVESSRIFLPSGVKLEWAMDRAQLLNAAETSEKRKDARVGRELVLALPAELSSSHRQDLAGEMACHLANRYHLAVDVAIHQPNRQGDERNFHAHILMSSRRITQDGFGEKARELDDRERGPAEVEHIRATWAQFANIALERCGQERIDHRSLQAQGITRFAPVHLGPSACAMERRGLRTRLGDRNRSAGLMDRQIRQFQESLSEAAKALAAHLDAAREFLLRTLDKIHEAKSAAVQREATVENVVGLDVLRQAREDQERAQEARRATERREAEQKARVEQERTQKVAEEAQKARDEDERLEAEQEEQKRIQKAKAAEAKEVLLRPLVARYNETKRVKENAEAAWKKIERSFYYEAHDDKQVALEQWSNLPLLKKLSSNKKDYLDSIEREIFQNRYDAKENSKAEFDIANSIHEESITAIEAEWYHTPETIARKEAKERAKKKNHEIAEEKYKLQEAERIVRYNELITQEQKAQEMIENEQRLDKEHQYRKDRGPSRGPGMGM